MRVFFLKDIFNLLFVIIGTFIGAGFASGKEIYLYFYRYGILGCLGIFISAGIMSFVIFKTIKLSIKYNLINYNLFIDKIVKKNKTINNEINNINKIKKNRRNIDNKIKNDKNKINTNKKIKKNNRKKFDYKTNNKVKFELKNIFEIIINIFLIMSFCVMVSGFVGFMHQEFFVNNIFSYFFIIIFLIILFNKNVNFFMKINTLLVPIIIFCIIYFSFILLFKKPKLYDVQTIKFNFNKAIIYNGLIYAGYNLLSIIPIIIPLSNKVNKIKNIKYIGTIFFMSVILLSALVMYILSCNQLYAKTMEMPVVSIISCLGIKYKIIYCCIIGIAIITSALSVGRGYIDQYLEKERTFRIFILVISSLVCMPIGFSKLLKYVYPIFGCIGIFQSILIIKTK